MESTGSFLVGQFILVDVGLNILTCIILHPDIEEFKRFLRKMDSKYFTKAGEAVQFFNSFLNRLVKRTSELKVKDPYHRCSTPHSIPLREDFNFSESDERSYAKFVNGLENTALTPRVRGVQIAPRGIIGGHLITSLRPKIKEIAIPEEAAGPMGPVNTYRPIFSEY